MKIIVCIKQVPDTTEIRIDPETGTMIRKGVPPSSIPMISMPSNMPCPVRTLIPMYT